MPDLSDDELDALFRQGAEHYPEELNLGAWARMEQKLDEAHVQRLVNRKVARWFAAEVGIVAVLLLLWGSYRELAAPGQPLLGAGSAAAKAQPTTGRRLATTTKPAANSQAGAAGRNTVTAALPASPPPTSTPTPAPPAVEPVATTPAMGNGPVLPQTKRLRAGAVAILPASNDHNQPTASAEAAAAAETGAVLTSGTRRRLRHARQPLGLVTGAARRGRPAMPTNGSGLKAAGANEGAASRLGQVEGQAGQATTNGSRSTQVAPGKTNGTGSSHAAQPGSAPLTANEAAEAVAAGNSGDAPASLATTPASVATTPAAVATDDHTGETTTPQSTGAAPQHVGTAGSEIASAATIGTAATAATALSVDGQLQPVQPQLLLDDAAGLPELLPADSIVRRRPRPFVPSRLFVAGLYAPELTTVRNAGYERPGHSTGIQVEYLLTPRLRLSVGLLSSVKYYRARGKDYTWAWPPAYPVERVEATCRITDIPVNLRFDAWQGVRYRAFVGAGVSSLLMRDESYYYSYSYYGNPMTRTWQIKNGKNHPFSVVNLSAGLERQLSLRWALQAEPYLKLPLGGVGQGKVRLSSGGVFFGLKYGL